MAALNIGLRPLAQVAIQGLRALAHEAEAAWRRRLDEAREEERRLQEALRHRQDDDHSQDRG